MSFSQVVAPWGGAGRRRMAVAGFAGVLAFALLAGASPANAVAAAKVGGKCTKVGVKSGALTCTKKAGRLVWARVVAPVTSVTPAAASPASTKAPAAAESSGVTTPLGVPGIDGVWRATSKSEVGYRVKEVLLGQSTEGVGRTSAVTGTLTITGTKVSAVDLKVDMTKLESDSSKRDAQVQNRILETSKFPTASLKLSAPVDFGAEPADKEQIKAKATASLTVRGVTKPVSFDVVARRNGSAIEVNGTIPFVMNDFGIPDPSLANVVKTEQNGLLEFLVVFER